MIHAAKEANEGDNVLSLAVCLNCPCTTAHQTLAGKDSEDL